MAIKRTSVTIIDKKESLPLRVNHSTRKWEIFDPTTNAYKDTGIPAVPEDDATAMKYYKLTNTPVAPPAVGNSSTSWADVASLNNAVITQGGWSADPQQVSLENRFCWAAYYRLENVQNVETGVYSQRYKLNMVGLYNNYAASPTISVARDGVVTVTNPDGTTQTINLMTAETYNTLFTRIQSLQSQVDSAVYAFSGKGAPTKDYTKYPLNNWDIKSSTSQTVLADIYNAHVGDTYTNTDDYVSYRFVLKEGMSASDPESYEWKIIADGALSAALLEIAKLGNSSVKIFTAQPAAPYKMGDMWIEGSKIKTCITAKDTNGTFAATDWIVPFATKEELDTVKQDLQTAQNNLSQAQTNIGQLQTAQDNMSNYINGAFKDSLIDENERKDLQTFNNQLDVEQEQLLSNVAYLKASDYLPSGQKTALENAANKLLAAKTGTMDVLQTKIEDIINPGGDQTLTITTAEKNAYNAALAVYKADHKSLSQAIDNARAAIDDALKKYVDNVQVGGRNLLRNSEYLNVTMWAQNDIGTYDYTNSSVLESKGKKWLALKALEGHNVSLYGYNVAPLLTPGETYTFSVVVQQKSGSDKKVNCYVQGYDFKNATVQSDTPTKMFQTFTVDNTIGDTRYIILSINNNAFELREFKLEKGNKATDWQMAPEDTEAAISVLISNVDVEYGLSNSATVQPTVWSTTAPTWQAGKFMWSRQKITKKDGTVEYKNATCIQGAEGKGITGVVEQYYQSTSPTSLTSGSWVNAAPASDPAKYIWTRSVITYTDSETTTTDAVRTTGVKGTDALSVTTQIQGYFRNYWDRVVAGNGVESYVLKKEVVGGVEVNGTKYVQATALIRKGTSDVTDSAIANGAALEWYVNGVKVFGNVKTIYLGVEYADGNDDQIYLDYDDTNALNW